MWYMQISVYIHNCACALAETLILRLRALIQHSHVFHMVHLSTYCITFTHVYCH